MAISLTTLGTGYTQDFNNLAASGSATWVNDSSLAGWYHARTGTGTTIVANDGSSNAGNLYSYGTGTAIDRALGSLGSGNAAIGNMFWGVALANNTGSTITSLEISYTGEQWRNSAAAAQTVSFSYLVGSPVSGDLAEFQSGGVAVPNLDFTSPITGGAAGALDGNLAANQLVTTFTITGLSIANGTQIMLRWSDPDHPVADHGLAIDDFSVTPQGAVGTVPVAGDDTDTVAEDALLTRDAANGLLGNDNDPDGPFNAVAGTFETTEGGTITIGADGSYTYMAPSNFAGTDTVDYTITDGTDSDTGTLTVTVNAVADGPNVHAGASGLHRTIGTFDFNQFGIIDPRLNIGTADEDRPRTAATDDGGFVMVWTQSTGTPNILAQRFQANGDKAGDVITVSPAAGPTESQPDVAAVTGGGFGVVWVQSDGGGSSDLNVAVYGNPLSPSPTATLTLSNPGTVAEINPTITFLDGPDNQFVVTWAVEGGADTDIFAQRFEQDGTLVDPAPVPLTGTADLVGSFGEPTFHSVAALGNGSFAVTWLEGGNVKVQVFDDTLTGGAIQTLDEGALSDRSPDVALLAGDRFVVVWEASDGGPSDLWAQFFNAAGTPDGTPVVLTAAIPSSEFEPSVSGLPDGGFAVSWLGNNGLNSTSDVRLQTFNADGSPRSGVSTVTTTGFTSDPGAAAINENDQSVTVLADGRIHLGWVDPDPDTATPRVSEDDILYQVFDPGSGEPLQVSDIALTITVPTKFFLFDQDGSETLDLILVQGLSDFGHSLAVGYQDVNFDFDPGPYIDAAWVIQRGHSPEEDALLDALIADPDNTNIIINLSGPNPGQFNFGINGMTAEASNALTRSSFSRTIDVQFVDNNDEPTLTATGNNPTFAEGGAAADLYGSVTASTVESGQTFTSLTLTVTNVTDGANEVLRINGIDVALTHANSVNVTVGTATVTLTGTTATVALSGLALSEVQLQTLVDGLAYRNDSENPTNADRLVTIIELVDSGGTAMGGDDTATLNIASTVNVDPVNDPPTLDNPIPEGISPANAEWIFQVPLDTFDDPDGDTLTVVATLADDTALPSWLTFNSANQTFTGTPPLDFTGQLELKVTASDAAFSVSDTFSLTLEAGQASDINLTDNPDNFTGTGLGEVVNALGGDDTLAGGPGNDRINGNNGNDKIAGGTGANILHGNAGNDFVTSVGNLNVGFGDQGNDQLFFVGNQNQLFGSEDNDWLGVSGNNNALAGGAGDDWLGASGTGNTVAGQDGNDMLVGNGNGNFLYGEAGHDWLGVSGSNNSLFGGAGNDWLGATGNNNTLDGGVGNDTLVSGAGSLNTTFVFHAGYGQDEAIGFDSSANHVANLETFGIADFDALQAFMAQVGSDVVITLNTADIFTLRGVALGSLGAGNFDLT